jgi:hypothetical protein
MAADPSFVPLTGGCRCGQTRFRMEAAPIITHCCHCRTCQGISGSAFGINAMIETAWLTVLEGEPQLVSGADGEASRQCPACGSTLWAHLGKFGEAIAFVGTGVLDEGERLAPEAHYFIRSKHPWVTLPPGVPAFETLGDPGKAGTRERVMAAMATLA